MLREDNSHITYKVKQALNFLFFNNLKIPEFENEVYQKFLNISEGRFTIDEISCSIKNKGKLDRFYKVKKSNEDIFHLPPSIFEIDYVFENGSLFSYLSSGEKQFIYSINSILYHLTNLNSTYENETINKYKFLNLILDEIELYSHPEMQKQFVSSILAGISKLSINNIRGLNILFITHSPFILSDIPKENVLFLDDGKPQNFKRMNTFGANITDLLADSFFINDGLMGDFAKGKIDETIKWLNRERTKKQDKSEKSYNLNLKNYEYHKKIVQLVDEPILKMKLAEMLDELQGSSKLQQEIAQKEIDFLKNKFNL
ncbi:hypothetical protein [Chryseobacterium salivictor]|uniref:ATPase AAA-type core domain-containing protein n=1 Tax=Chryseobacterium salivictor TaxID=2547600 RepID=A0A4P6ZIY8_9FLAO|nr:hypothetical protein [Chryseobacterium salivictor]QBO59497.1 hypothetical protein NBC122_02695 [Chryseobacterium salivictor]